MPAVFILSECFSLHKGLYFDSPRSFHPSHKDFLSFLTCSVFHSLSHDCWVMWQEVAEDWGQFPPLVPIQRWFPFTYGYCLLNVMFGAVVFPSDHLDFLPVHLLQPAVTWLSTVMWQTVKNWACQKAEEVLVRRMKAPWWVKYRPLRIENLSLMDFQM